MTSQTTLGHRVVQVKRSWRDSRALWVSSALVFQTESSDSLIEDRCKRSTLMTSSSWSSMLHQVRYSTTNRWQLVEAQLQSSCIHMTLLGNHHGSLCGSEYLIYLFWLKLWNHCHCSNLTSAVRSSCEEYRSWSTLDHLRSFASTQRFHLATARSQ